MLNMQDAVKGFIEASNLSLKKGESLSFILLCPVCLFVSCPSCEFQEWLDRE